MFCYYTHMVTRAGVDKGSVTAANLADWLLAHGRDRITTPDAAALLGIPEDHVRQRLHRQIAAHRFFTPARGLWLPVPPNYRTWGVTPGEDFIHILMTYLHRDYYVGWLSAAAIYGAAHHAPQVFQVAVDRQLRDRDIGRVRLRFVTRADLAKYRLSDRQVPAELRLSSPPHTAFDLADAPELGGGVSNVATVLGELADDIAPAGLLDLAQQYPVSTTRRLGYIFERIGHFDHSDVLRPLARTVKTGPTLLDPHSQRQGLLNSDWQVVENTELEIDL